eukprot:4432608-Amphidinium_carterae.2
MPERRWTWVPCVLHFCYVRSNTPSRNLLSLSDWFSRDNMGGILVAPDCVETSVERRPVSTLGIA